MKTKILLFGMAFTALGSFAQEAGNANYGNNHFYVNQASTVPMTSTSTNDMVITIRGIYNEQATAYIATFSILQVGKTAEETTSLIDEKVAAVKAEIQTMGKEIDVTTDMISFVPTYAYEVEKKIFNPKTYNEKPAGFELKKNLIIKYKNRNDFDKIVAACARQEIYDLAKVDYVTANFDQVRSQMQAKALEEFKKLLGNYSLMMNTDLSKKEKIVQEGYNVLYPMESYRQYQAFSQANVNFADRSLVNNIKKNTTQYYNSVPVKSHSFVMNAEITEPAIQVFYDLTISIKLKEDQLPKNTIMKNNKYYVITLQGDIKPLNI